MAIPPTTRLRHPGASIEQSSYTTSLLEGWRSQVLAAPGGGGSSQTSSVFPGTATSSGGSSFISMCGGVRSSFEEFRTQSQLSARPV